MYQICMFFKNYSQLPILLYVAWSKEPHPSLSLKLTPVIEDLTERLALKRTVI